MTSWTQWRAAGERVELATEGGTRRLFVRDSGPHPGGARPMLLLHGFPTSSLDWASVWPALTRNRRCVAFDFLGFGASDKPRPHDYRLVEQADLVERVVQATGLASPIVVAHDYAVSVAQELLARTLAGTGTPLSAVAFLNGGLFPALHRPLPIQRVLASPLGALLTVFVTRRALRRSLDRIMVHPLDAAAFESHWESIAHDAGHRLTHALLAYIAERRRFSVRWSAALHATRLPLAFIWGMQDPISGGHVMRHLRTTLPLARHVPLEDVGHYPQLEAPDAVVAALEAFAAEV